MHIPLLHLQRPQHYTGPLQGSSPNLKMQLAPGTIAKTHEAAAYCTKSTSTARLEKPVWAQVSNHARATADIHQCAWSIPSCFEYAAADCAQ